MLFAKRPGVYVVVAALWVLIILCMIYLDRQTELWVRSLFSGEGNTKEFFRMLTRLGTSGWLLVFSAIVFTWCSIQKWEDMERSRRLRIANLHADSTFIFFAVLGNGLSVWLVKNLIGRARPRLMDELGHLHFDPATFKNLFASFPSGHATTFGTLCMAMALMLPRHRWVWVVVAIFGGFSRAIVGAHYVSDVFAGLIVGAFLTWLAARYLAQRGVMFRFTDSALPRRIRVESPQRNAAKPRSRSAIRSVGSSRPT